MNTLLTQAATGLWIASSSWFTWLWMSPHIKNPAIPRLPVWLLTAAVFVVVLVTTWLLGQGIGRGVHRLKRRLVSSHSQ